MTRYLKRNMKRYVKRCVKRYVMRYSKRYMKRYVKCYVIPNSRADWTIDCFDRETNKWHKWHRAGLIAGSGLEKETEQNLKSEISSLRVRNKCLVIFTNFVRLFYLIFTSFFYRTPLITVCNTLMGL